MMYVSAAGAENSQSVIVVRFSETISDNRVGEVGDLGFDLKVVSGPFLTISTR